MRTLTHFQLCPYSRGIRLALAELNIEVRLVEQRPWEIGHEFLRLNPAGELPVLQVDDGLTICGALAISEYLDETKVPDHRLEEKAIAEDPFAGPTDTLDILTEPQTKVALLPGGVAQRAEVRRLVDWFHGRLNREVTRALLHEKIYGRMMRGSKHVPHVEVMRAARHNLRYHLGYIGMLFNDRRWLAGDDFSYADMAAAAQLSSLDYLGEVPWDDFRHAKEWYQRVKSRQAFWTLLRDRVPGVMPPLHYDNLDF